MTDKSQFLGSQLKYRCTVYMLIYMLHCLSVLGYPRSACGWFVRNPYGAVLLVRCRGGLRRGQFDLDNTDQYVDRHDGE
jgi:hypothetical protein